MTDYPQELIPKTNYRIIDSGALDASSVLSRRSRKPAGEMCDDLGDLRIDSICHPSQDLFGNSWNLLGVFLPEHNKFEPSDGAGIGYMEYWNPGHAIFEPSQIAFTVSELPSIFLYAAKIHDKPFPYKKDNENLEGKGEVKHFPIGCNYWHFQLSFYDKDRNEIGRGGPEWSRKAAKVFINSILKKHCRIKVDNYSILPVAEYSA